MTTLSPPPNWYADPSGRHESRYWDGFTWTPHVADGGQPDLDPLVRTEPTPAPAVESRSLAPIGPGTASLREMATSRPEPSAEDAARGSGITAVDASRRRGAVFDATAALAVLIIVVLGGYVLWNGWDDAAGPASTDPRGSVTWTANGITVDLPPSWVEQSVPADHADAIGAFTVIDRTSLVALVGTAPITTAAAPDGASLETLLATTVAPSLADDDSTVRLLDTEVVRARGRLLGVVTVELGPAGGATTRAVTYVVVDGTRSVTVTLLGQESAVARHLFDARKVAVSASSPARLIN